MDHGWIDGNITGILLTTIVFSFTAIMVGTVVWARHRARELRHATIRLALEKGQPLPPEILEASARRDTDLGRGVKLLFLGLGLASFLWLMDKHAWPVGLILVALGLGHLVSHWLARAGAPARPGAP